MTVTEATKKAITATRNAMAMTEEAGEEATLNAFLDAFDAEIEGWKMRLEELSDAD